MCKVLTAAGSPELRRQIRAALPRGTVLAGEARDGESAMPMLRDLLPDVMIIDAGLPFSDSLALTATVRHAFPWVQVILLSGRDDAFHRQEACALGVREVLIKPVRAYELSEALQRAADARREMERALKDDLLRARRIVPPERRALERSLSGWLESGADAPPLPRCGKYCRMLTFSGVEDLPIAGGVLRLMEGGDPGLFALDLPGGPALAVSDDDPERLEIKAYGAACSVCLAARRLCGVQIRAQIGRICESPDQLRESWRENILLSKSQPENRSVAAAEDAGYAELIARARTYIEENCARTGLSAEQTARALGMTAARLCVLFEQETGLSFTHYLAGRRILRAQRLLRETRMRISSVAAQVGFDEPDSFAAAFEAISGQSPAEYRRNPPEC